MEMEMETETEMEIEKDRERERGSTKPREFVVALASLWWVAVFSKARLWVNAFCGSIDRRIRLSRNSPVGKVFFGLGAVLLPGH